MQEPRSRGHSGAAAAPGRPAGCCGVPAAPLSRTSNATSGAGLPASRRRLGLRAIPLETIVGSAEASKARRFDASFRPPASSRRRWEGLWVATRRGRNLPPISVYRLGDCHYVDDGHHRVSVAQALGMAAIDAEVTEIAAARL